MNIHNIILQLTVFYPGLIHIPSEQVTPFLTRGMDPKVKDIYVLHDKGIKTIISLRTNPERRKERLCRKLGMQWINIKTGVFHTPREEQLDEFRAIVNNPANRPIYFSCEVAMDRTGAYLGAYRMVDQHWTAQQVQEEFNKYHQKKWWKPFRNYEAKIALYAQHQQQLGNKPETICTGKVQVAGDAAQPACSVTVSQSKVETTQSEEGASKETTQKDRVLRAE